MSNILDYDLDNVVEPQVAPADEDVEIRIVDVKSDRDKNEKPYLLPRFEVVGNDYAKEFTRFIRLPYEGMTAKEMNNCKFKLREFYEAFDVDYSNGVDPEELKGRTGWAILGIEIYDGQEQNYVKKFVTGK